MTRASGGPATDLSHWGPILSCNNAKYPPGNDMQAVDLLHIMVEREEDISADRADIHVSVTGSSVFSGTEALQKADEVNALVEALKTVGLGPDAVLVEGVRAEVASGVLTKSSAASYALRIRLPNLTVLPAAIELVATRKNATLTHLEWKYDAIDRLMGDWLAELLRAANAKAELVARALGVTVMGVHAFREERWDPDRPRPATERHKVAFDMASTRRRSGVLGFDMMHSKRVRLAVQVDYRVSARG
jgi:uncharacterized protein YggE